MNTRMRILVCFEYSKKGKISVPTARWRRCNFNATEISSLQATKLSSLKNFD